MQYVSLEPFPKNIDISKNIIYKWPAIITKIAEARQKTIEEFNNQKLTKDTVNRQYKIKQNVVSWKCYYWISDN